MTPQPDILHYAVSVVGKDRTGIVSGIAEALFRLGCNIADSSCTMLAGEFAVKPVAGPMNGRRCSG